MQNEGRGVDHRFPFVADSFETSECESHKSDQAVLRSDIAEASRVVFDRETCSPTSHEQHGSDVLLNKNSDCHTTPELTRNKFHHPSKLDSEYFPQDFDICIPDSVLEHKPPLDRVISESNNDACTTMNENSNKVKYTVAHDFPPNIESDEIYTLFELFVRGANFPAP